jgi:uncharacterized protein HemY
VSVTELLPFTWFEVVLWTAVAVVVLRGIALRLRSGRSGQAMLRVLRPGRRTDPWNYEAALVRMCHGDKRSAERLIAAERERNPSLSRAGAALAAVTRMRHERP